jgi:hypothetical protein
MHAFPCLASCVKSKTQKVELVNRTVVEEVLQDLGVLDFGKGITAKANVALWRERGMHTPLVGEFSFQAKFKRRDELHEKAMERCKEFFISLQQVGADWVSLGTTKTGVSTASKAIRHRRTSDPARPPCTWSTCWKVTCLCHLAGRDHVGSGCCHHHGPP